MINAIRHTGYVQLDARGNVIPVIPKRIYTEIINITNAELKSLYTTAVEIIPNQGEDTIIMLYTTILRLNAGSEALTESSDNLVFVYKDKTGVQASQVIETTNFIDQTVDTYTSGRQKVNIIGTPSDLENQPLCIFIDGNANFGGNASGDATLSIWIRYTVEYVGV